MKRWNVFTTSAVLSIALLGMEGCPPVQAQQADSGAMPMDMNHGGASSQAAPAVGGAQTPTPGQVSFAALKQLIGKWEAPMGGGKTIVDTFQPFAFGSAILAEEWVGGQQITSTVFYLVGSELRADHYCDYLNQPRYTAKPATDPSTIEFEFREATNLDTHPTHFHSTTWHLVDATHMTQDWTVEGGPKGKGMVHLQFVRQQ
jgi:hypothetical protein